jgi:SAM-dependent methyltransferase
MLRSGERQVAANVEDIRRDHTARYEWSIRMLPPKCKVLDLACGVGYGSDILAAAGHKVTGVDISAEAIEYAKQHYSKHGAEFICADARNLDLMGFDAVVSFETLEHVEDAGKLLRMFRSTGATILLASVPNEDVLPYRQPDGSTIKFHHRHYRPAEFAELLQANGWNIQGKWGQAGPTSLVEAGVDGRTLVYSCERAKDDPKVVPIEETRQRPPVAERDVPEHVVIIGLGPSSSAYMDLVKRLGNRHVFADEVWAINAMADVVKCDRIFHMDDLEIQEARAAAQPGSNIDHMIRFLRTHPGPIYTSRLRPVYPGLVEFPLEDVLNNGGFPYFNSTAAYAIAYAVHIGVKKISLYGLDYTMPNVHSGEQGRGCCEFWIGLAMARGVEINVPEQSSLMDACVSDDLRFYGYDCVNVLLDEGESGVKVAFEPREKIPTAEEIERRYDHKRPTNNLLRK